MSDQDMKDLLDIVTAHAGGHVLAVLREGNVPGLNLPITLSEEVTQSMATSVSTEVIPVMMERLKGWGFEVRRRPQIVLPGDKQR